MDVAAVLLCEGEEVSEWLELELLLLSDLSLWEAPLARSKYPESTPACS